MYRGASKFYQKNSRLLEHKHSRRGRKEKWLKRQRKKKWSQRYNIVGYYNQEFVIVDTHKDFTVIASASTPRILRHRLRELNEEVGR